MLSVDPGALSLPSYIEVHSLDGDSATTDINDVSSLPLQPFTFQALSTAARQSSYPVTLVDVESPRSGTSPLVSGAGDGDASPPVSLPSAPSPISPSPPPVSSSVVTRHFMPTASLITHARKRIEHSWQEVQAHGNICPPVCGCRLCVCTSSDATRGQCHVGV